jgi:DNA helicase-2/ATP-dependent DNA helicase PcrA
MAGNEVDILLVDHGTITAPAGCGKTHLIADALTRYSSQKPVLVLTHTNAGVAALRGKLNRFSVPVKSYQLSTIDGWAMRLISTFPLRSAHDPRILELTNPRIDYPKIREAAVSLLRAGHISDILAASYSRLIVDEYQDCSIFQHSLIANASVILPTCVLGDPLQAIFGFGGDNLARWDDDVCACFPVVGELNIPWRWINAKSEPLGEWLLDLRRKLLRNESIDLRTYPAAVHWIELNGVNDHQRRLAVALVRPPDGNGNVLIIGDSTKPVSQQQFASQTPGAVAVEAVDLKDLVLFGQTFDPAIPNALDVLLQFAENVMTNVGAATLIQRVHSLIRGTARKPPSVIEQVALEFVQSPSFRTAINLLVEISKQEGVRIHRPTVFRACIKSMRVCQGTQGLSFHDAVIQMREQNRFIGRSLPRRAVGSTLLLKGLEADVVVILNADDLDARNLYVAMTRGSKSVFVCSQTPILNPQR